MINFLLGILASIIATFLYNITKKIYSQYLSSKSHYSGEWQSSILDNNGIVIKKDNLLLVEKYGKITGTMKRIIPVEQNHREWLVSGFAQKGHILLAIIAKDENQASDGSVYVMQKYDERDNTYDGFYLKAVGNEVEKFHICLEKVIK